MFEDDAYLLSTLTVACIAVAYMLFILGLLVLF